VQAVLHLVATAVPGLRPQHISIIDSRGELLARGGQALAGPAAAQIQDELRRTHELRLARAVEELLERTLGPGRVRAEATVDLDFDRVQTMEERFDPENQVPRSTQSTTEQNRGAEPQPTTVASNLPGTEGAAGGATSESKQEETTNFEIGRTTRNTTREHPVMKRLSIAVLVDGVAEASADGPPRWRERTPEELTRIGALVRSAVGFDERRGDRVEVISMRFVEEAAPPAEAAGPLGLRFSPAMLTRLAESGLLAAVALAAILLLGRPMVRRLTAALLPSLALAGAVLPLAGTLPEGGEMSALPPAEGLVSLAHVQGQMRASSLQTLAQLVDQHPDAALGVMRRWLAPPDAS